MSQAWIFIDISHLTSKSIFLYLVRKCLKHPKTAATDFSVCLQWTVAWENRGKSELELPAGPTVSAHTAWQEIAVRLWPSHCFLLRQRALNNQGCRPWLLTIRFAVCAVCAGNSSWEKRWWCPRRTRDTAPATVVRSFENDYEISIVPAD